MKLNTKSIKTRLLKLEQSMGQETHWSPNINELEKQRKKQL
jgi:hypothetical protein